MIREPAVAGHFYPDDPQVLRSEVERFLRDAAPRDGARQSARAVIVPHAGYVYSGPIAAVVYAGVAFPRTCVILCPNHTGRGRPIAVMNRGGWRTPLGVALVEERLANRILDACPDAAPDAAAHDREHALEVQIPFLQCLVEDLRFVPVCVGTTHLGTLTRLGHAIAAACAGHDAPVSIVISSDMSHYIAADEARRLDMMAIDRIVEMDPEGLHRVVHDHDISMCGVAPAVAGLTAAKDAGARAARLLAYGNSGDVAGDHARVVAYAGLAIP